MEEIEDQLDSEDDDTAFLVTNNSSTGGNEPIISHQPLAQEHYPK